MITINLKDQQLDNIKHEIVDNKVNIIVTPEHGTFSADQVVFPEPKKYFDLLVTVDCADLTQLGSFYKQNYAVFSDIPSINVDHHVSNKNFGSLNLVDTKVSSTTQLLFSWFKEMNAEIDEDIATLLLAGIITDTGSFQNANTTPECFDAAAELIDLGGRQQEIIKHVYKTKQLNSLKLWGKILSKIQVNETYRYLWSSATQSDFQQTGTNSSDKGDIIDELMSNAQEADVILLLEEKIDGSLHGSLRSTSDEINISSIAQKYNGGGHAMAAGFTIPNATVDTHQNEILAVIEQFQKDRTNVSSDTQSISAQLNEVKEIKPEQKSVSPIFQEVTPEAQPESPQGEVKLANDTENVTQPMVQPEPVVSIPQPDPQPETKSQTAEDLTQPIPENTDIIDLPSVDEIVSGNKQEESTETLDETFSTEPLKDPTQGDFNPFDLQDELNSFNQSIDSDSPKDTTPQSDIDKLARDFVSREDQQ
jgi:phosphoesterase RecJ-like protein